MQPAAMTQELDIANLDVGKSTQQVFGERLQRPRSRRQSVLPVPRTGITPFIFWEGTWDQRLHYLTELPKGKTVGAFQSSDIFKAKQVLGDTCVSSAV